MRSTATALVALLALSLAACGEDDDPADTDVAPSTGQGSPEPAPGSEDVPDQETPGAGEIPKACELADADAVEAAYGLQVPPGEQKFGGHDDSNSVRWQSDNCDWEAPDALEVSLQVARPDDFEDPARFCPELSYLGDPSEPVDGLGDEAHWVGSEDPDELEATLRVCTGEVMFDLEVDAELGGATLAELRDQTVALAGTVLERLGAQE